MYAHIHSLGYDADADVLVLRGYDDLIDFWKTHVSIREIQDNSFGSFR